MRKMTKILGLVILIVLIFSIAMAGDYIFWLQSFSYTLCHNIEGQRLTVMNILTDMRQIDEISVYRNNECIIEKDYYYLDDHILEVLICPHPSYPLPAYGIYYINRTMEQSDELYLGEDNIHNILSAFRHEFDGKITWSFYEDEKSSEDKQASCIEDVPVPKDKEVHLNVDMWTKPGESMLSLYFIYAESIDGWCIRSIDILQYEEPEVIYK